MQPRSVRQNQTFLGKLLERKTFFNSTLKIKRSIMIGYQCRIVVKGKIDWFIKTLEQNLKFVTNN